MKTALVTGGTRGIGEGVARELASKGWKVIAGGVSQAEIDAFAPQAGITPVVNCAGVIMREGKEFTVEGFRKTIEVNLVGTMRVCLAAKPKLLESGGAVVNTASMLSFFGSPFVPGYSASKGGVAQLTKSLAAAWGPEGIRVNAVAPGWIATELTRPLTENPERSKPIVDRTPMGRWGDPSDVAGAVMMLLSDDAKFVTGTVLPVDGGYLTL